MSQPFTLPPLPYAETDLEPTISANTLRFHHGKHHKAYVDKLNELVSGSPLADAKLEEIIRKTHGDASKKGIFNNAAQAWNHTFYWSCMRPKGGGRPSGEIAKKIEEAFGSYETFQGKFVDAAVAQFGSGWAWVVLDGGKLSIVTTSNAENPLHMNLKPILTTDVWEHAYYLDYQNRRKDFVAATIENLLNWDFANENLAK
ncbi:MAG: superoxide dismutase [Candidatus Eisenbacteria bacterium]|nr:superoxide dismutase [Candidatus Eisenbacteria bacterium]